MIPNMYGQKKIKNTFITFKTGYFIEVLVYTLAFCKNNIKPMLSDSSDSQNYPRAATDTIVLVVVGASVVLNIRIIF